MEVPLGHSQEAIKDIGHLNDPQEPTLCIEDGKGLQARAVHEFGDRVQIGFWSDADERRLNEILHEVCWISSQQFPNRDSPSHHWWIILHSRVDHVGHLDDAVSLEEHAPHLSHSRRDSALWVKQQCVCSHQPTG